MQMDIGNYKFRGKSPKTGEWLYGDLVHAADGKRMAILVNDAETYDECEVIPGTVGQFVELTDSNKKDVYEGDILKWKEYDFEKIGVVIWNPFCVFIGRPSKYGIQCIGIASTIKETEVIGNIHNNPELMKGASNG